MNGKHPYLSLLFSFIFYGYNQRFADLVACVPSVSARVNALKLEREQKKKKTRTRLKRPSVSLCLEIRSRNVEANNSTQNRIYSLKVFYFLLYQRRYFLLVSDLI